MEGETITARGIIFTFVSISPTFHFPIVKMSVSIHLYPATSCRRKDILDKEKKQTRTDETNLNEIRNING